MNIINIKRLYTIIISSENKSEVRSYLHRMCDNLDFEKLMQDCITSDEAIMMIKHIKNEYETMIENEKISYKISDEELKRRINKLKMVVEIYENYSNPYIRFDKMIKIFKNPNVMYKTYFLLIKYGKNDPKLDKIRPYLLSFSTYYNDFKNSFNSEVHKVVNNAYEDNNKCANYEYGEFIIREYLNDKDNYLLEKFLNKYNIDEDIFNYFVCLISFKNQELYEKYLLKKRENDHLIKEYNKHIILDLSYAIKNNEFIYGNKFDIFEFIKYIPFKNSSNFLKDLEHFINHNCPLVKTTIINYIKENELDRKNDLKRISLDSLENAKVTINNQVIYSKQLKIITDYLISRDIPITKISLKIACKMYLNNELNIEDIQSRILLKEKESIIIPKVQ